MWLYPPSAATRVSSDRRKARTASGSASSPLAKTTARYFSIKKPSCGEGFGLLRTISLRRHYPDQVCGSRAACPPLSPVDRAPRCVLSRRQYIHCQRKSQAKGRPWLCDIYRKLSNIQVSPKANGECGSYNSDRRRPDRRFLPLETPCRH